MALTEEQINDFKNTEEESTDSEELRDLAENISEAGDKEWARKVYKKAEEKAENEFDLQDLARSIAKTLGDKEWARKVYKKAEEKVEDVDGLQELAEDIADTDYLGDKEWARELYKKAEEKAVDSQDLSYLAQSIAKTLGDKEWARKVYKKAEEKAVDSRDYRYLAESIENEDYLGDKEWARELYKKSEESGEDDSEPSFGDTLDETEEGIVIYKAFTAIAKWLRLERELDHIQVWRQAAMLSANVVQGSYGLSQEQIIEANKEGIEAAVSKFEELGEVGYRPFMKSLGVAGVADVLSSEGKGDLITLLRIFLRIVVEYETEEVVDKYAKDIKDTCMMQLDGEDVWSELEETVDSLFLQAKEDILNIHPI